MKNKNIEKALIQECVDAILKIIIYYITDPNSKGDSVKPASSTPIKNISCFLGYLTLAQNKPLLTKYLDLKQLMIESHLKNCMSVTMLVACKVLRAGEKSRLFHPHNPWMVSMYSMLIEYHENYLNPQKNQSYDKNIEKEIKLVLKNRNTNVEVSRD